MKCSDYYFSTEYIQDISFVTSNPEHTRTKGAHGKSNTPRTTNQIPPRPSVRVSGPFCL